jgi:hypothetical protein
MTITTSDTTPFARAAHQAVHELDAATERYEREHEADLVVIDTSNLTELRRDHPGLFSDSTPADVVAAYARQADELAAMVEQYDTAHRRHITVLLHALGDLHVAMDELATRLGQRPAGGAAGLTGRAHTTAPVTLPPETGQ